MESLIIYDREFYNESVNEFLNCDSYFFLESDNKDSAQETKEKTENIMDWIKKNCWHKPRAWFAKILAKLNHWMAKIRFEEEVLKDPKDRGILSKIKTKLAQFIGWLTNKIETFVRPDKIGDKENEAPTSINQKMLNRGLKFTDTTINSIDKAKQIAGVISKNKTAQALASMHPDGHYVIDHLDYISKNDEVSSANARKALRYYVSSHKDDIKKWSNNYNGKKLTKELAGKAFNDLNNHFFGGDDDSDHDKSNH